MMAATEASGPVTQDILIGQLRGLELFLWFVRAHLESSGGRLTTADATTDQAVAEQARRQPWAEGARCAGRALAARRPEG